MKTSIAITLIIIAAIFSFVIGYSIGTHSDQATRSEEASKVSGGGLAVPRTPENSTKTSAPAGGYGSPSSSDSGKNTDASPGYGSPAPGYGK